MFSRFQSPVGESTRAYTILVFITSFFLSMVAAYNGASFAATHIVEENFEGTTHGWDDEDDDAKTPNQKVDLNNRPSARILGEYSNFHLANRQRVFKSFNLPFEASQIKIEFDMYQFGWDRPSDFSTGFEVFINNQLVAPGISNNGLTSNTFTVVWNGNQLDSDDDVISSVKLVRYTVIVPITGNTVKIGFGAKAIELGNDDLSISQQWGVDNFKLTADDSVSTGSLAIQKSVTGTGASFAFTTTGTGLSNFTLTPANDGAANQSFTDLAAGTYTITENELTGYNLTGLTCAGDTDNGNSINLASRSVTIDLDAGETQTCAFASTEQAPATGSIAVSKSVTATGASFAFTTTGTGLSNFTLTPANDGAANQSFTDLAAGTYTITENELAGYNFTSLSCTGDTDNGNSINLESRSVTIDLDPGETQICTFVSTQQQSGGGETSSGRTSTPNGDPVGTTSAKFGVTPSGAASYSIPLAVPKGTASLQPQLALQYNSQDKNGILGMGWKVTGLSYINRCPTNLYIDDPEKGGIGIDPVDYDDNDQFCLNGVRLRAVKGAYGADGTEYHTFFQEFSKVISHGSSLTGPTSFTVYKKTGEILTYGGTADSRFQRQTQDHVRTWALSRMADAKGNYINYKYHNDRTKGEFYITEVNYTGNDAQGLVPYNSVKFLYENRTDKISQYNVGDEITLSKRVSKIQVFTENQLAHEYRMSYGAGDTGHSRITSITECANATTCFKPTTFHWSYGQVGPTQNKYKKITNLYDPDYNAGGIGGFLDFDGDGLLDVRHDTGTVPGCGAGESRSYVILNKGNGDFTAGSRNPDVFNIALCNEIKFSGDFNGDGKTDIYHSYGRNYHYINVSNGDGTSVRHRLSIREGHVRAAADFNGDGLTDLFVLPGERGDFISSGEQSIWYSNGDGTFRKKVIPDAEHMPIWYHYIGATGDFNGDGRADIYVFDAKYNGTFHKSGSGSDIVMLSNGEGRFKKITIESSEALPDKHKIFGSGDFNGDGLKDFYTADIALGVLQGRKASSFAKGNDYIWLSKGDGTFKRVSAGFFDRLKSADIHTSLHFYRPIFLSDTNGDGRSDIILIGYDDEEDYYVPATKRLFLSNADSNFNIAPIELPYYRKTGESTAADAIGQMHTQTGDFNGDGLSDYVINDFYEDDNHVRFGNAWPHLSTFLPPEKITKITNGHGLSTSITYKHLTDSTVYTKGTSASGPVKDQISARQVVSKVEIDNGTGTQNAQSYTYEGLQHHNRGLGNLGFRKMVMTDEVTGIKTESIYSQDWANHHQGLLEESKTIAPNGIVLNHRTVDWKVRGFKDENGIFATCFRYADSSTVVKRDLNGAFLRRIIEKTTFDDYGFRTRIEIKTENEDSSKNFSQVTENTFTHNTDTWRLGQLTNSVTTYTKTPSTNASDTVVRTKSYTYDTDGYLLSETTEPGNALTYTNTNTLNAYGAIASITETWGSTDTDGITETSRITSYEFDDKVRYVTKETNPLGHSATSTYHPILGLVTSTTGPNGLTTTYEYDDFGRKVKETRADGTTTSSAMDFCSETITCPSNAVYRLRTVTSSGKEQRVFMNKLNLEVKSSALLEDKWSDITTEYDVIGRVVKKSQPHYTGENAYYTLTEYDILDRKTKVTRPDLSTQTATFNGLTQISTNELGQNKTVTKNLLDKDAVITNHEGQSITYSYDGAGQLLGMNANGGITTYVYDIRGNKVSDSDPDKGTWTYRYNALGKIVEQTNAKGETTRMTYDVLERMLSRVDNATAANPEQRTSTWEYDTAANGIGKLHKTTSPNYIITNTYDALSRVTSTTEKIDGTDYTTSTTYDSQSRPDTITYPSGLTIKNSYDNQSNLLKVAKPDNTETWWERKDVDARGNITRADHGNGVNTHRTYDPETGRLTGIYSYKNAEIVQDLTYTKDALGNLTRREDKRLSQTETFVYDNLNRVTTINTTVGGNTSTVTMTYGITGNILSKSDVGTYTYGQVHASCTNGFAGPHAVTTVSGTKNATYCYDANGNMTSGDGRTVTYTAFDKPTKMVQNGNSAEFFYGPDRKRYKRIDSTIADGIKTTLYVAGKAFEKITTATEVQQKHYIGDFAVVTITNNDTGGSNRTSYLHRDHLGSVDVITNEAGSIQQQMSFDAWGKRREINWTPMTLSAIVGFDTSTTTRGFTGHEMIDAVGLVHMNGRVYDPTLGRFLSADPIVEAIDNLQTYNRYSYVRNNPLTLTDPSGFEGEGGDSGNDSDDSVDSDGDSEGADNNDSEAKADTDESNNSQANPNSNIHSTQDNSKSNENATSAQQGTFTTSVHSQNEKTATNANNLEQGEYTLPSITVYASEPKSQTEDSQFGNEIVVAARVGGAQFHSQSMFRASPYFPPNSLFSRPGPVVRPNSPVLRPKVKIENKKKNKTPNPYGAKGKPDHQKKVDELEKKALKEAKPGEKVVTEKKIQGHDSRRIPDVQIIDKKNKTRKVFEAERYPNRQRNQNRESEYNRLGISNETFPLF